MKTCGEDEIFYKKACRHISKIMKRHYRTLPPSHILQKRLDPSEKRKWNAYWKRRRRGSDREYAGSQYKLKIYLIVELIVVPVILMIMLSIADRSWYTQWWWWCIYIFILLSRLVFCLFPYVSIFLFHKTKPRHQYWQHAGLSLFHWFILLSPFLLLWSDRLWVRVLLNILIPFDAYLLLLFLGTLGL